MSIRMCDLFAGIGGIRLGFEGAFDDSETVFVSEWDAYANKTYQANFGDSVPIAGRREGFADNYRGQSRGTLFADVVRICEKIQPKVIFCENVKGLIQHDRGNTFKVIVGAFEEIGYTVFYKVLNSKDFGVPQNRERIYIVCFRNDIAPDAFEFPESAGTEKTIQDILQDAPIPTKYYLSDTYVQSLRNHKARHASKGNGFGYVIRDLDGIAGACVCGGHGART